jgi:uncharacterized membrane protein YoaK (UPF0700 family)
MIQHSPPPIVIRHTLTSRTNLAAWCALSMSAGCVNVIALLATQRFVTHVTGTLSRFGSDFGQWTLFEDYALLLVMFMLGAGASVWFVERPRLMGGKVRAAHALTLTSLLLVLAAVLGQLSFFGRFGEAAETWGDFMLLAILSFSMGLQNATVASVTSLVVRTTHMTGHLTDLGTALASLTYIKDENRRRELWYGVRLRVALLTSFAVGCAMAVALSKSVSYGAFMVPALLTFAGALRVGKLTGAAALPPWLPPTLMPPENAPKPSSASNQA